MKQHGSFRQNVLNDEVSVLNREPMGMKPPALLVSVNWSIVSVLNREPMGMKLPLLVGAEYTTLRFSAQPRADGDEACSAHPRASRCR